MKRKTKADLERENKRLKKENFRLSENLNDCSKFTIGLSIYGLVVTACLVVIGMALV